MEGQLLVEHFLMPGEGTNVHGEGTNVHGA